MSNRLLPSKEGLIMWAELITCHTELSNYTVGKMQLHFNVWQRYSCISSMEM